MEYFKSSFKDFSETLKTLSLVIGFIVTAMTGLGFAYSLVSDVSAHGNKISKLDGRVTALEADVPEEKVARHRLTVVENTVKDLNVKADKTMDLLQDFRADLIRELRNKSER